MNKFDGKYYYRVHERDPAIEEINVLWRREPTKNDLAGVFIANYTFLGVKRQE